MHIGSLLDDAASPSFSEACAFLLNFNVDAALCQPPSPPRGTAGHCSSVARSRSYSVEGGPMSASCEQPRRVNLKHISSILHAQRAAPSGKSADMFSLACARAGHCLTMGCSHQVTGNQCAPCAMQQLSVDHRLTMPASFTFMPHASRHARKFRKGAAHCCHALAPRLIATSCQACPA